MWLYIRSNYLFVVPLFAIALLGPQPAVGCECHPGVGGRITCYPLGCDGGGGRPRGSHWCQAARVWCEADLWCTRHGCSSEPEDNGGGGGGPPPPPDPHKQIIELINMGAESENAEHYQQAAEYYRQARDRAPRVDSTDYQQANAFYWAAAAKYYEHERQFEHAIKSAKESLRAMNQGMMLLLGKIDIYEEREHLYKRLKQGCFDYAKQNYYHVALTQTCPQQLHDCTTDQRPSLNWLKLSCFVAPLSADNIESALRSALAQCGVAVEIGREISNLCSEKGDACRRSAASVYESQTKACVAASNY